MELYEVQRLVQRVSDLESRVKALEEAQINPYSIVSFTAVAVLLSKTHLSPLCGKGLDRLSIRSRLRIVCAQAARDVRPLLRFS